MRDGWAAALRAPAFRRLFAGYTTSALGDGLQPLALTFAVLGIGGGAGELGIVIAASQIPKVVLGLLGGVWADRMDRRHVLVISDLACAGSQLTLVVLLVSGQAQLWHFVVLSILYGAFRSVFVPATSGLVPDVVPDADLRSANGLLYVVRSSGYLVGAPVASVIVAVWGPTLAIGIDAVTFVVSAACVMSLRIRSRSAPGRERTSVLRDLRGGWLEVRSRRWLLAELLRSTVDFPLVVAPFMILGPVIAQERLGGAPAWAAISTAFFAGTVLGPVLAHRFRPRRPMLACTVMMYLGALPSIALAFSGSAALVAASELVKGVVVGFFSTVWATLLQREVPAHARSRVSAWDYTLTTGLMPLGYLLAGSMMDRVGSTAVLLLGAAWAVAGASLALLVPEVRRLRDTSADTKTGTKTGTRAEGVVHA